MCGRFVFANFFAGKFPMREKIFFFCSTFMARVAGVIAKAKVTPERSIRFIIMRAL